MYKLTKVFPSYDSPYIYGYVDFDRQYTVGKFIEETLKKYSAVSGYFSIDGTSLEVQYAKGELSGKAFPEKVLESRIAAVSFYTGCNEADYVITKFDGE